MTQEEVLSKVKGCLAELFPVDEHDDVNEDVEEIIKSVEPKIRKLVARTKTAHWIEADRGKFVCSNCFERFSMFAEDGSVRKYHICPECGARMIFTLQKETDSAKPTIIDENVKGEINKILDKIEKEVVLTDGWWFGRDRMIKVTNVFQIINKCREKVGDK